MNYSQALRAKLLQPVLALMANAGIRPGAITFTSMLCGLAFCPLFITGEYAWAVAMLALHVILDGVDGPLARQLGSASDRGSFTDTVADQVVISATTIALIYSGTVGAWSGGLYLFLYTAVVTFAMVRNAFLTPYSWLFRPRFLVYLWLIAEIWLWPGSLNVVLWVSVGLLLAKSVSGFTALIRVLPKTNQMAFD